MRHAYREGSYLVQFRVMVALFFKPPPLAVTTTVDVPTFAPDPLVNVRVLPPLPGAAMLVAESFAATPVGTPEMLNATELLKPPDRAVVNVTFALLPAAMLREMADGDSVKFGGAETFSASARVFVTPPPIADTVTA